MYNNLLKWPSIQTRTTWILTKIQITSTQIRFLKIEYQVLALSKFQLMKVYTWALLEVSYVKIFECSFFLYLYVLLCSIKEQTTQKTQKNQKESLIRSTYRSANSTWRKLIVLKILFISFILIWLVHFRLRGVLTFPSLRSFQMVFSTV